LIRSFILIALSAFIGFVVVGNAGTACAQSAACDSDFQDVMNARATMEATREVEMAQRIILKPDSVLEYSCFDDTISNLNQVANRMFSDNIFGREIFNIPPQEYEPPGGLYDAYLPTITPILVTTPGSIEERLVPGPNPPPFPLAALTSSGMDTSLRILVFETMQAFLSGSFSHVYAGGTFDGSGAALGEGICNPMDLMWSFSKCQNFDPSWFPTLAFLSGLDQRTIPIPCNNVDRAEIWAANLLAANPEPGMPGGVDIVAPLDGDDLPSFYVEQFVTNCSESVPIPTGVRVYTGAPPQDTHADAVCLAPGCYYDPSEDGACRAAP